MTKWHNVDEQLLTAVGTVTVAFSRLEWIISGFIWQLLSPNQMIGQTITANLTFRSKLDLLSSLLELLPSTEIPEDLRNDPAQLVGRVIEGVPPARATRIKETLSEIGALSVRRNALQHALSWLPGESGAYRLANARAKGGKPLEWRVESVTVDSVSELSEQMFGASEKLSQLLIEQFGFSNIPTTIPKTGHGTLYEVLLWGWLKEPERQMRRAVSTVPTVLTDESSS